MVNLIPTKEEWNNALEERHGKELHRAFSSATVAVCGLLVNVRKYTDPQELTAQMVNDLVDKIIVHAPDKSSGHRKQKIEIYYNAVGIIDLPTVKEDDCIALHGRCKGKKIAV